LTALHTAQRNSAPEHITKAVAAFAGLRARGPRVHCLTNTVAQPLTANALLAAGAAPSLTGDPAEVAAFVSSADALLVNLGTLEPERARAIEAAVGAARGAAIPWVLDPVFIERSEARARFAAGLVAESPAAIRANGPEFDALLAIGGHGSLSDLASSCGAVLVRSGPTDEIVSGHQALSVLNGSALMGAVTAMGCAAGALIAAMLATENDAFAAVTAAVLAFGVAGERASEGAGGPGTFQPRFLDALYGLDADGLKAAARIETGS